MQDLINKIHNADCLEFMKQLPDKSIDLVLTDPPYGIDYGGQLKGKGDGNGGIDKNGWKSWEAPTWDKEKPTKEFFEEIFRISKNQIIWGGNYFNLPISMGWLVWNKGQRNFSLADGELAWTSFNKALRIFDYSRGEQLAEETRIHPTQKPLALIKWCLDIRSSENDLILDCFSGSGTTAIACSELKRNFICIEKDKQYYEASCQRLENYNKQLKLF
jgi:site-specific DNA-methyltransferase (adenine-specific)